eukprot:TRINITY_DN2608_c0_g1_i2.p1 TRINITY_DN2608_c0_g1~~TRINITY_DN2608_c0_g1_i2.p1  ORF type:complete len:299 (-),score=60.27 TRINITY_DN2608_c0_g1_i2:134-1030(-)
MKKEKRENSKFANAFAGAGAGTISAIITCPLEVVKTVLQVQRSHKNAVDPKFQGTMGTLVTILKEDGIRGCYRGLGTTMLAMVPNWAIYFTLYEFLKQSALRGGFQDGPAMHMATAMVTGACVDAIVNPLWMIKTRLQTQRMKSNQIKYHGTFDAFHKIVRDEGWRALFKGLTPQLLGCIHVGIQFPLYEYMKSSFADLNRKGSHQQKELKTWQLMASASFSKAMASIIAYPHEVLRSRFQFQSDDEPNRYKGILDAIKRIHKEEGIRGFYRGLGGKIDDHEHLISQPIYFGSFQDVH